MLNRESAHPQIQISEGEIAFQASSYGEAPLFSNVIITQFQGKKRCIWSKAFPNGNRRRCPDSCVLVIHVNAVLPGREMGKYR